jgi:hypothetical protein
MGDPQPTLFPEGLPQIPQGPRGQGILPTQQGSQITPQEPGSQGPGQFSGSLQSTNQNRFPGGSAGPNRPDSQLPDSNKYSLGRPQKQPGQPIGGYAANNKYGVPKDQIQIGPTGIGLDNKSGQERGSSGQYPGSQQPSISRERPQGPSQQPGNGNLGYPSDKPRGPGFPSDSLSSAKSDREYLPPRSG